MYVSNEKICLVPSVVCLGTGCCYLVVSNVQKTCTFSTQNANICFDLKVKKCGPLGYLPVQSPPHPQPCQKGSTSARGRVDH